MTKPIQIKEPEAQKDVVKILEELLESAKNAEITGILVFTRERADGIYTYRCIDDDDHVRFLGEIEWLKWTLVERMGKVAVEYPDDGTD